MHIISTCTYLLPAPILTIFNNEFLGILVASFSSGKREEEEEEENSEWSSYTIIKIDMKVRLHN